MSLSETERAGRAVDAVFVEHRGRRRVAALLPTTEAVAAEELMAQPGAIVAPGFADLAEGPARPSSPV